MISILYEKFYQKQKSQESEHDFLSNSGCKRKSNLLLPVAHASYVEKDLAGGLDTVNKELYSDDTATAIFPFQAESHAVADMKDCTIAIPMPKPVHHVHS